MLAGLTTAVIRVPSTLNGILNQTPWVTGIILTLQGRQLRPEATGQSAEAGKCHNWARTHTSVAWEPKQVPTHRPPIAFPIPAPGAFEMFVHLSNFLATAQLDPENNAA